MMRSPQLEHGPVVGVLVALGALSGVLALYLASSGRGPGEQTVAGMRRAPESPAISEPERESDDGTPAIEPSGRARPVAKAPEDNTPLTSAAYAQKEELRLTEQLRQLEFNDPEYAVHLAESFNRRFPDFPEVPELAWYHARNLVYLARFDEAQHIARTLLERHPDSPWSRDLGRHLLSHPLGLPAREH